MHYSFGYLDLTVHQVMLLMYFAATTLYYFILYFMENDEL